MTSPAVTAADRAQFSGAERGRARVVQVGVVVPPQFSRGGLLVGKPTGLIGSKFTILNRRPRRSAPPVSSLRPRVC